MIISFVIRIEKFAMSGTVTVTDNSIFYFEDLSVTETFEVDWEWELSDEVSYLDWDNPNSWCSGFTRGYLNLFAALNPNNDNIFIMFLYARLYTSIVTPCGGDSSDDCWMTGYVVTEAAPWTFTHKLVSGGNTVEFDLVFTNTKIK